MNEFIYKTLSIEILEEVTKMFITTFNSEPWNEHWTIETAYTRLQQWLAWQNSYGLVCYYEDNICGMILGHEEQDYQGVTFTIREFCIDNNMRGMGIGSKLYFALEKQLLEKQIQSINLLTIKGDMTEKFYQKIGFKNSKNIIYMEKHLLK